jgi:hypothetical protein
MPADVLNMNNKIQRLFDRSIADAVRVTKEANDAKPRRNLRERINAMPAERAAGKGRLYLDKATGATVWEPASARSGGAEHG